MVFSGSTLLREKTEAGEGRLCTAAIMCNKGSNLSNGHFSTLNVTKNG